MPIIHVHYVHDLTPEQKETLVSKITTAVAETANLPTEHVQIWLHQTDIHNHAWNGSLLANQKK